MLLGKRFDDAAGLVLKEIDSRSSVSEAFRPGLWFCPVGGAKNTTRLKWRGSQLVIA